MEDCLYRFFCVGLLGRIFPNRKYLGRHSIYSWEAVCVCVSEAVAANKLLRQSWLNLPLSEALFSHYCLPRTTPNPLSTSCLSFTACFKSHLLQEKLSEITSVRMNHFPSHGIFFLTAPKAFTSCVNYLYLSLYSLLSCELQKGMSRIFLCFLQPCKCSAFHTTYALQMLTER